MPHATQTELIRLIKVKIGPDDALGQVLAEQLSISLDAAYRRMRNETPLTIRETQKLCLAFDISFDALCQLKTGNVIFSYPPLNSYDFSLESYFEGILAAFKKIKANQNPKIILTINNTHFFQLINFPQLARFKLFFWAKTHLQIPAYQNMTFKHEKTPKRIFELGNEILQMYNSIPSVEIFDPELMRGFMRQILYYYQAQMFEDPSYALFLCDRALMLSAHLKAQAEVGKKFIYGTQAPAQGNDFDMYFNETINSDGSFYYESDKNTGLFITHNIMNYLHTDDPNYLADAKQIIDKQLANSSLLSVVNEKARQQYFADYDKMIRAFKKKIEADLEFE